MPFINTFIPLNIILSSYQQPIDRATLNASRKQYNAAIDDFTRAIEIEPNLAEAYFNRGLVRIYSGNKPEGLEDLSKAGELGLFNAYSLIKKYKSANDKK